MKICILGNCQAQHLEMMLSFGNKTLSIDRLPPVFDLKLEDKDKIYNALHQADVIFAQRIANEFGLTFISSNELRIHFGNKIVVWPNIYFDGIFPGIQYIYHNKFGKLLGPLGDYHFSQIYQSHKLGMSVQDAVVAFSGNGVFHKTPDPIGLSLEQLRERELECDVQISDYLESNWRNRRLNYTPNHPTNHVLGEMLTRLCKFANVRANRAKAENAPYRLDQIYIPASSSIIRRFSLPYDEDKPYKGNSVSFYQRRVELGSELDYDPIALVVEFYRVYDFIRSNSGNNA